MSRPPSKRARRRAFSVLPSEVNSPEAFSMIWSVRYVTKNGGCRRVSSPACSGRRSGIALSRVSRCSPIIPSAPIRLITSLRRSRIATGWSIGSYFSGARIMPASVAPSSRLSSARRLPEVELGGCPEAVDAVAHVDLVQVQLEDPLLRVALLHADRQGELLQLAFDAVVEPLLAQGASHQLLRDASSRPGPPRPLGRSRSSRGSATTCRRRRAGRSPSPRSRARHAGSGARSPRAGRSPGCRGRPA